MILYCDTSALVKLYVEEEGSSLVRSLVAEAQAVAIAAIGYVEAKAAFARAVQGGRVTGRRYREMLEDFERDWSRCLAMDMTERVIRQAGRLAEQHRLRAYDAVHLAAVIDIGSRITEPINFLGFDDELDRAARTEGISLAPKIASRGNP